MSETYKKSVYDVLMHNLKLAGRKTFICRYIYVGEHKNEHDIEILFTKIVKTVNEDYCEELLTGLLLLYPNYFVHIVDGDEIVIQNHLSMLFDLGSQIIGTTRLLCFYHHVNQRFFNEWGIRRAKPPMLLEKIDPASDFEEVKRYLDMCVKKIYNLAIQLREIDMEKDESIITIGEILPHMSQYLPEYNLLQFLLNSNDLYSMQPIAKYSFSVLKVRYDLELIWPARNDYVPFNIFDDEINPIQNLPTNPGK